MIAVKIICVGKLKEKFYSQAVDELTKRLSRYCKLEIAEITGEKAPEQLSDTQSEQLKAREGKRILERLTDGEYLIATAIDGQSLSSEQLARRIDALMTEGKSRLAFAIGGSLGLSDEVLKRADFKLSFSKLTFTHQLFRIMLLEQLYRAFKINLNEPYHK